MNDRRLHAPEYKVCYHFRGGHAGVLGEVVGNVPEGWPGGADLPTSLVAFIYLREEDLLDTLPEFRSRFESLTKT